MAGVTKSIEVREVKRPSALGILVCKRCGATNPNTVVRCRSCLAPVSPAPPSKVAPPPKPKADVKSERVKRIEEAYRSGRIGRVLYEANLQALGVGPKPPKPEPMPNPRPVDPDPLEPTEEERLIEELGKVVSGGLLDELGHVVEGEVPPPPPLRGEVPAKVAAQKDELLKFLLGIKGVSTMAAHSAYAFFQSLDLIALTDERELRALPRVTAEEAKRIKEAVDRRFASSREPAKPRFECPECGRLVDGSATRCKCGVVFEEAGDAIQYECPLCSEPVDPGAARCKCGARFA